MLRVIRSLRFRHFTPAALLALAGAFSGIAGAADQATTFRFNPPDGITGVGTSRSTNVAMVALDGQTRKMTEEKETTHKRVMVKLDHGFQLTETVVSWAYKVDGKPQSDALLAATQGCDVVSTYDQNGRLQSLRGADVLMERVQENYRKAGKRIPEEMTQNWMERRMRADWQIGEGDLIGRSAKVGSWWIAKHEIPEAQVGDVMMYSFTKVARRVKSAGQDCVEVTYRYDTDPKALAKTIGKSVNDIIRATGPLSSPAADVRFTESGTLVIDPATMLKYHRKSQRAARIVMSRGDVSVPVSITGGSEHSYKYTNARW